ncbi:hypothetical protein ACKKBG_A06055 [Auxenochlorella protothecoides x Auxenochlorella symbiontica]
MSPSATPKWVPAITKPLSAIASLPVSPDDGKVDISALQAALLQSVGSWDQVPLLTDDNVDGFPCGTLVRYTGMVQDMLNPEYYVGAVQLADGSWVSARFQDQVSECMPSGAPTKIEERRPLFLTAPPGTADWARPAPVTPPEAKTSPSSARGPGGKRERDADGASMNAEEEAPAVVSPAARAKRGSLGQGSTEDGEAPTLDTSCAAAAPSPVGCMVYVVNDLKAPVLNDIVTVVGILSIVPELAACCQEDAMDAELAGSHPPTSRCPRLHALAILPGPSPAPPPAPLPPSAIAEARLRTIGLLSLVLGGDDLAAEYLLLQLVGRVHARREDAGVIGTGSLNLTGCPAGQASGPASLSSLGQALALALQALMPRSVSLGLTTSQLTARPWWPRRDQNTQRLLEGRLQMAKGTQVLLDETVMSAGTLNEVGVRNLQAVDVLVRTQKVAYDFEFFSLDQEADAPVTVLSCGRSLLKDALGTSLPLAPTAPLAEPESLASMLQTSSLDGVREYLAAVRALDFTIPSHVAEVVEKDLASARQKDAAITPASLHHLLNVARLLAVSHGEAELTAGRWAAVQSMELRRSARCNPTPSA